MPLLLIAYNLFLEIYVVSLALQPNDLLIAIEYDNYVLKMPEHIGWGRVK